MSKQATEQKHFTELLKPHKQPGTLKLKGYKPQKPPDPEMAKALRQLVIQAIFGHWYIHKKPFCMSPEKVGHPYIAQKVRTRINKLIKIGQWKYGYVGKKTIDRRVREAADPRFYPVGEVPKIVCVTAGCYQPNPVLLGDA